MSTSAQMNLFSDWDEARLRLTMTAGKLGSSGSC